MMWRVWLVLAASLGVAIASAEAAHPSRATCADRDSALCSLYRSGSGYSGHKLARSHTNRVRAKSRIGTDPTTNSGRMHSTEPTGAKPIAGAAPANVLAARAFDPLASGNVSGELPAPPVRRETEPWVTAILIALGGGGVLSLFLAKAAEL